MEKNLYLLWIRLVQTWSRLLHNGHIQSTQVNTFPINEKLSQIYLRIQTELRFQSFCVFKKRIKSCKTCILIFYNLIYTTIPLPILMLTTEHQMDFVLYINLNYTFRQKRIPTNNTFRETYVLCWAALIIRIEFLKKFFVLHYSYFTK